jgi:hypothetical protein
MVRDMCKVIHSNSVVDWHRFGADPDETLNFHSGIRILPQGLHILENLKKISLFPVEGFSFYLFFVSVISVIIFNSLDSILTFLLYIWLKWSWIRISRT